MLIRYDTYGQYKESKMQDDTPCIIYDRIERSKYDNINQANWHEDLEIELFTEGEGYILIGGEKYNVKKQSIAIINSNLIHYTGTESSIIYYPIIIDFEFCKKIGIDCSSLFFDTLIDSKETHKMLETIIRIYYTDKMPYKKAKLSAAILNLLISIAEKYSVSQSGISSANNSFEQIKSAIKFIREHYSERLTLDTIARNSLIDKYNLSKKFKLLTGQTVVEFINNVRCERIKELMHDGVPIGRAAAQCGFNNISFFTKTFKKYNGMLPSEYRKSKN